MRPSNVPSIQGTKKHPPPPPVQIGRDPPPASSTVECHKRLRACREKARDGGGSSHPPPGMGAGGGSPSTTPVAKRSAQGRGRDGMRRGQCALEAVEAVASGYTSVRRGGGRGGRGWGAPAEEHDSQRATTRDQGRGTRGRGTLFAPEVFTGDIEGKVHLPMSPAPGETTPHASTFTPLTTRSARCQRLPVRPHMVTRLFDDHVPNSGVPVENPMSASDAPQQGAPEVAENWRGHHVWVRLNRMQWGGGGICQCLAHLHMAQSWITSKSTTMAI
jgi:hypothetical protein